MMVGVLHDKTIKSADRVLEILEMFDAHRQSLTVMEVARTLNVPQSSTSELLNSLVRRGYLARGRRAREYRPTARVALLGAWVQPSLFRNGRLLSMMDELHAATGLATTLCSIVGVRCKHLHLVERDRALPEDIRSGHPRHPLHSPFGRALVATGSNETIRKLVHRLNAESPPEEQVRPVDLVDDLATVRRQGHVIGPVAPGWSGMAVILRDGIDQEQLSIGFIGPQAEIADRRDELLDDLRGAIARHMGAQAARDSHYGQPGLYGAATDLSDMTASGDKH